jgi:hypothetical protein
MPQILHQNREKLHFLHVPKTDKVNKEGLNASFQEFMHV